MIRAVGQISYIISADKLSEQLPKLLPGIIAQYKKQAEQLPITEVCVLTINIILCIGVSSCHSMRWHCAFRITFLSLYFGNQGACLCYSPEIKYPGGVKY